MPNALSPCLSVPSNLHIWFWRSPLASYTKIAVIDSLEFGWPANYTASERPHPLSRNHPFAMKHASTVKQFVSQEVAFHATSGFFLSNSFDCELMTSPLLTIPKKSSDSCRIVMDLSFSPNHSVNDGMPIDSFLGEPFHLCLPGVDSLVEFI